MAWLCNCSACLASASNLMRRRMMIDDAGDDDKVKLVRRKVMMR